MSFPSPVEIIYSSLVGYYNLRPSSAPLFFAESDPLRPWFQRILVSLCPSVPWPVFPFVRSTFAGYSCILCCTNFRPALLDDPSQCSRRVPPLLDWVILLFRVSLDYTFCDPVLSSLSPAFLDKAFSHRDTYFSSLRPSFPFWRNRSQFTSPSL